MNKKLLIPLFLAGMAIPVLASRNEIQGVNAMFVGEFGVRDAYIEYGSKINTQLAEEGFVLLKNDGTLPLAKRSKITLVGKASVDIVRGGAGSGSINGISSGVKSYTFENSLEEAGFELNTTATTFYKNARGGRRFGNDGWKGNNETIIGETPLSDLLANENLMNSFGLYDDLAIQVISREGQEGCDLLTIDATDDKKFGESEKHELELSDNEQALFDELHNHFDKILIIINSSNIFEVDQFVKDPKVAGILWVGNVGDVGAKAIGEILNGTVNPSGRTVDTWTRDFYQDPSAQNFSDNRHNTGVTIPNRKGRLYHQSADTMFNADGSPMRDYGVYKNYNDTNNPKYLESPEYGIVSGGINGVKPASYISYEEGVYLDYRYYETCYVDMAKRNKDIADLWYNGDEGVVYPFGYGLSYTTFTQEIVRVNPVASSTLNKDSDLIEVSVKVTNTGKVPGKDAVQLYWKAPYIKGEIEKADHVLCAFDKTGIIKPGKFETVHLTFHLQDVANYDFNDANKNGHKGYELDAGDYAIMCMKNAHELYEEVALKVVDGGIVYDKDRFTNNEVKNRFTDRGIFSTLPGTNDIEFTPMSRSDFAETFPHYPSFADRTVKEGSKFEEMLTTHFDLVSFEEGTDYAWVPESAHKTASDGAAWTQTGVHTILLEDMIGVPLNDPKWDEFINEFSWEDLMKFVENYKMSSPSLTSIGKPTGSEGDGPQKFNIIAWVSAPIIAATFNPDLAYKRGECIGMEAQISGKCGWWGTAVNLHRSPFGGRNFEYFSTDPFLSGRMGAQIVKAVTASGVYCYVKHFAVNEQEKNREGLNTFLSEQALRELYLKPFQMVVEEGKTVGIMSSYNRLGLKEVASNYPLLTEVLRNEWGFKGSILSDMTHSGNPSIDADVAENVTYRTIAGCNCELDSGGYANQTQRHAIWDQEANNGVGAPVCVEGNQPIAWSFWYACRENVKQHLHMFANSSGMLRGTIQIVGKTDKDVLIGENLKLNIENDLTEAKVKVGSRVDAFDNKNAHTTKVIRTINSYELDKNYPLPEGFGFNEETNVITGAFSSIQTARISVIVNVSFNDGTDGQIAYMYVFKAKPFLDPVEEEKPTEEEEPEEPNTKEEKEPETPTVEPEDNKCKLSAGTASMFVTSFALIGGLLLVLNKKRNK